ncbi:noncanonical pyrimidine nucleotidase, YjjG family [Tenacibaculum sp. SZ-18]|uniref:YjjG family noncanonical pyrimidine nucleotidase n=1 Tax=Tenacibaculum sp. SZ-18 TaxID=754423 RepID=UPI000C2D5AB9|nr:YjjG family noncanonical pyrimidine nucleotidase [Tenacibaculum sp. SZ-18]AUC15737.1 noncanonical pyrimidine nucleotidase, YjjG family [Tenacibaculum sp. SZ-18]
MTEITDIFFDLDHTLWDFDTNSGLTFKKIFTEQNIELDINKFLVVYEPINLEYWKLYRNEKIGKAELRYKRLKTTFDKLNFEISDKLINKISEDYITYLPSFNYLLDGAKDLLDYLKDKYNLHIITNGFEEVQRIKLEKSKINHYFNVVVTSESVGVKKPNPKVFEFALNEANVSADNSIMVGDSLEADVLGALAVGISPIYLSKVKHSVDERIISVKALSEIKRYL